MTTPITTASVSEPTEVRAFRLLCDALSAESSLRVDYNELFKSAYPVYALVGSSPSPSQQVEPRPEAEAHSQTDLIEVLIMGAIIAHVAVEESEGWLVETLGVDRMTLRAIRHDAQDVASEIMQTRPMMTSLVGTEQEIRAAMVEHSKWRSPLRTKATIAAQRLASKIAALKGQSLISLGEAIASESTAPVMKSSADPPPDTLKPAPVAGKSEPVEAKPDAARAGETVRMGDFAVRCSGVGGEHWRMSDEQGERIESTINRLRAQLSKAQEELRDLREGGKV